MQVASSHTSQAVAEAGQYPSTQILQALPESASVVISSADTVDNSIKIDLEAVSQDSSG